MMKGLFGECNIEDEKLREWVLNWDENLYIDFLKKKGLCANPNDSRKASDVVEMYRSMAKDDCGRCKLWEKLKSILTPAIIESYFIRESSLLSVANFHEILVQPADDCTRKKLVSGSQYVEKGYIELVYEDTIIGIIGTVSDLFYSTFYKNYVSQTDLWEHGAVNHIRTVDDDFSIQIWNLEKLEIEYDLNILVEKIIFDCSMKLDLNFKRVKKFNSSKGDGVNENYRLELNRNSYEYIPLRYFNSANDTDISRYKYLAYYQVIEFFYENAKREMSTLNMDTRRELFVVTHILNKINANHANQWISSHEHRDYYQCGDSTYSAITPIRTDTNLINDVALRIYKIRCSLVHSKESEENVNFIPNLNDEILDKEISLIRYLAIQILCQELNFGSNRP